MGNAEDKTNNENQEKGFTFFAAKKIIVGVLIAVLLLWGFSLALSFYDKSTPHKIAQTQNNTDDKLSHEKDLEQVPTHKKQDGSVHVVVKSQQHETAEIKGNIESHLPSGKEDVEEKVPGYAFVTAAIKPLEYELEERFLGWRPNDLILTWFTDNIEQYQRGVLQVTRRTAEILEEDMSRTGSTAAVDKNLKKARNRFMNEADKYWLPSPESEYKAGLKRLKMYREKLELGEAKFFTRTDNLIPLLEVFEKLLGSCDDNLVKYEEENGDPVSFWKSDDYFFEAKGVAYAMGVILTAVLKDFEGILKYRNGADDLHHAIESCHHAVAIKPLFIMNSDLDSFFANHRSNMAAHISHARFFIANVRKTLST